MPTPPELELPDLLTDSEDRNERKKLKQTERESFRKITEKWGEGHAARVSALTDELINDSASSGSKEHLIQRLAANSAAVAEIVGRAQLQLAERMERFVDNSKLFLALARSLKEATAVQSSTMRSVQELLSAAATIRSQRVINEEHNSRSWHEDTGGGFASARRNSTDRHSQAN